MCRHISFRNVLQLEAQIPDCQNHVVISRFRRARDSSVAPGLQVLGDVATGLLVNERVVNCPPQIGPPLMQALFDEISWAIEDEPTEVIAVVHMLCTAWYGVTTAALMLQYVCA